MTSIPMPNLPPAGGWRVTTQVQGTRQIPGSQYPVTGYTVSFLTGAGNNGSVFVPATQYTPATVQAAIAAQAAQLDAVSALAHDSQV